MACNFDGAGGDGRYVILSREELYKRALLLDASERTVLVGMLIDSLDCETEVGVEAARMVEVECRVAEHDSDAVETVPWEEVRERLRRRSGG